MCCSELIVNILGVHLEFLYFFVKAIVLSSRLFIECSKSSFSALNIDYCCKDHLFFREMYGLSESVCIKLTRTAPSHLLNLMVVYLLGSIDPDFGIEYYGNSCFLDFYNGNQ